MLLLIKICHSPKTPTQSTQGKYVQQNEREITRIATYNHTTNKRTNTTKWNRNKGHGEEAQVKEREGTKDHQNTQGKGKKEKQLNHIKQYMFMQKILKYITL